MIGTRQVVVEIPHDRGRAPSTDRWTSGSGYLIGGGLMLTAAHTIDYRQIRDEQLLLRTIGGRVAARVVLVCEERSRVDLALLEVSGLRFDSHLPPVSFARVNRESLAPVQKLTVNFEGRWTWRAALSRCAASHRPKLG